jgi:type IV fimbrial biogenesis protein FimT
MCNGFSLAFRRWQVSACAPVHRARECAMKCQKGFGLIELLVGLTLVGVLTGIAYPSFCAMLETQRHREAALQLSHSLRSARTEALLRSQTMWVQAIDDDWSRGWQIRPDSDDEQALLAERARNGKPRIVGNSKIMNSIGFSAQGMPLQIGNGSLFMCMRDQPRSHYQVIVAGNGRVRVDESKGEQALCG